MSGISFNSSIPTSFVASSSEKNQWSQEDIDSLIPLHEKYKDKSNSLRRIEKELIQKNPTLTSDSIRGRLKNELQRLSEPNRPFKDRWTPDENKLLEDLVAESLKKNAPLHHPNWKAITQKFNLKTNQHTIPYQLQSHHRRLQQKSKKNSLSSNQTQVDFQQSTSSNFNTQTSTRPATLPSTEIQPHILETQPNFQEFFQTQSQLNPLLFQDLQKNPFLNLSMQPSAPSITLPPMEELPQASETVPNFQEFFQQLSSQEARPFQSFDEQAQDFQEAPFHSTISQENVPNFLSFPIPTTFNEQEIINTQDMENLKKVTRRHVINWTDYENELLKNISQKHLNQDGSIKTSWQSLTEELNRITGHQRSIEGTKKQMRRLLLKEKQSSDQVDPTKIYHWTDYENKLLQELASKPSNQSGLSKNWLSITQEFNQRTNKQKTPDVVKGQFFRLRKQAKEPSLHNKQIQPNFLRFETDSLVQEPSFSITSSPISQTFQYLQETPFLDLPAQTPTLSMARLPTEEHSQPFQELSSVNVKEFPSTTPTEVREKLKKSCEKINLIKHKISTATHELQDALFECMEHAGTSQLNTDKSYMDWLSKEIQKSRKFDAILNPSL